MSTSDQPTKQLQPQPINIIAEYGIGLYSQWRSRRTGALLIVIQRQCEGAGVDMCTNLKVLDVGREVATDVHPEDFIRWIVQRQLHKQYR